MAMFNVQPWPLQAQTLTDSGAVVAADGSVLCEPTADAACDPSQFVDQAKAIEQQMAAQAEAAAQAQAEAEAQAQAEAAAQAQAEAEAQAQAEAAAQAQADAEAAAQAQAEADAQAQAEAEAQAQAEAAAQAQADAEAQAQADAEAAAQAQAEAEAQAQAEAPAGEIPVEEPAPAEEATDQAPMEEAVEQPADSEAATEEVTPADEAASDEAAAGEGMEAAPADEAAQAAPTDEAVEEPAPAEAATDTTEAAPTEEATEAAPADEPADAAPTEEAATTEQAAPAEEGATPEASAETAPVDPATEEAAVLPATVTDPATGETLVVDPATGAAMTEEEATAKAAEQEKSLAEAEKEIAVEADGTVVDPSAGLKTAETVVDPNATPVDVPVASETEVQTLTNLLDQPEGIDPAALGAAAALSTPAVEGEKPADQAPSADAVATVTEMLDDNAVRSSTQEFAAAPVLLGSDKKKKSGLSDLEKVGLVALGALVVGAIIQDNNKDRRGREAAKVVSNTGDRVVVLKPDGTYQVYKDDDAVLRQPGSNVRTETYRDGSTRTIVERRDGTQVVTIRDASGRVLRRAQYDERGRELVLIDDLEPERVVIVRDLPKPRPNRVVISTKDNDYALKAALAAKDIAKIGRTFSLRQIREIPEVRYLAATVDVDNVNFASGSSAIAADEASDLAELGSLMQEMLDANPGEMFLIEGHTDATGKAAMNLALSDRRAESVALALTEYFDIPPENMVIQGYGESELRIDTQNDEPRNRRVAVRIITPLLKGVK
ncbi:hypothetical protein GCM10010873_22090 [Cypionkella aquatica]|uniref:OmpA-like domain-containing protein n=2 Tax=Cypionkella aquatica TaxID=1756042 RepID=A0AA37U4K7_9RHOB|nr:hypothetical protein GCM10010873_22090 [Cypionkella aquatica]